MSTHRAVVIPVAGSKNDRAAGKREKPRKVCARGATAAARTAGVHWFGYRTVTRQGASPACGGRRVRPSRTSTSCISYAFESCAMRRHLNGEKNDGMAAISTRHHLPVDDAGGVRLATRGQTASSA